MQLRVSVKRYFLLSAMDERSPLAAPHPACSLRFAFEEEEERHDPLGGGVRGDAESGKVVAVALLHLFWPSSSSISVQLCHSQVRSGLLEVVEQCHAPHYVAQGCNSLLTTMHMRAYIALSDAAQKQPLRQQWEGGLRVQKLLNATTVHIWAYGLIVEEAICQPYSLRRSRVVLH